MHQCGRVSHHILDNIEHILYPRPEMEFKEDQTAPINKLELENAIQSSPSTRPDLVNKLLGLLNEKRDAYNGIVTSIVHLIDSQDDELISLLRTGLTRSITHRPMRFGGKMFLSKAVPRLVSERPLFIADLFEHIIESTGDWSKKFEDESDVLRLQIIALKAIRQSEQSKRGRQTKVSQSTIDKLCFDAISYCDDSTKVDTLSIVLESRSTTKPLEDKELHLFKVLFQDALSFQEPGLRQIFIALTNKLLKRLKASHVVVARDKKRYSIEQQTIIRDRYISFLEWLIEFCLDSIYCNAYFGSFILTISTLKLVIQHISFQDNHLLIEPYFRNRRCYESILSCLNDSFDENKERALDLLLCLPYNEEFFSQRNLSSLDDIAYRLVSSVNPAHSSICQYVFKLVVCVRSKQVGSPKSKNQLLLEHLGRLVDIVEQGIMETREDFVNALKHEPIYPKLSVIRALLDEVDYKELEQDRDDWIKLAKRIVSGSIEACKAVSNIVCNLNPETIGHLPMDLEPVDVDTLSRTLNVSLNISPDKLSTITSQMMLICGWKTIKECSLSLGSMCIRFWWPKEKIKTKKEKFPGLDTNSILKNDDMAEILKFFDHYLKNLRHRGAFEQAYNGFIMVTRRVWHDEHLRSLLIDTLHGIMNDFRSEALDDKKVECLKAYVTRRSAGLPFIVQAILNSEHKHDSETLRWVLDCLFEVLESENSEPYQKIHCLNILRALIKEHFLGEKVISYVGRTFAITMESFKSDSFSIRNCANMLLKATIDRTFGVNRLRDDISRRNQLSFERFFTECPNLQSKMIRHLEDGLKDKRCLATVHSVFIVLFRLKPSLKPHRGYISDVVIKPFIDPIAKLALGCPDYKIRELAAKLFVRLQTFCSPNGGSLNSTSDTTLMSLFSFRNITNSCSHLASALPATNDQNKLHGTLLIMKNWVDVVGVDLDEAQMWNLLRLSQRVALNLCLFSDQYPNDTIIKSVALDLVEACCLRSFGSTIPKQEGWLKLLYDQRCFSGRDFYKPYFENLVFKYITILLMVPFPLKFVSLEQDSIPRLQVIIDLVCEIVIPQLGRKVGIDLQASLLRFVRQVLSKSNDILESLFEKLDIDFTAAHVTPFDRLKLSPEYDLEREKLIKYCDQKELRDYLIRSLPLKKMFDLTEYNEFREKSRARMTSVKFSAKSSNTPRSIELLALVYENWEEFDFEKNSVWLKTNESLIDKLDFITNFISSLPDCDVKCLALLCAGKAMQANIDRLALDEDQERANRIKSLEQFCNLLDELTDGHHSLTIRETCCEVLRINIKGLVAENCNLLKGCQISLFSALIKLSQDEEHDVRSLIHRAMASLRRQSDEKSCPHKSPIIGSRSDYLIKLITSNLFKADSQQEINSCFELMMRIIFNHSKNYSTDTDEEKERLFDKTKLNAFADHIATVKSCLDGLQAFFGSRQELIELSTLQLTGDILSEFAVVDQAGDHNIGDYSWRLRKVADNQVESEHPQGQATRDNNAIVNEFLRNLLESLSYFSKGYYNMLIDTDYTYHELSLYKRVAFVKFVLGCTKHSLNENIVGKIKETLRNIVGDTCSTTMLHKCLKLMD